MNCQNNAAEQQGPGPFSKRDAPGSPPYPTSAPQLATPRFYKLASGREIMLLHEPKMGDKVYRVTPRNATLYEEQLDNFLHMEELNLWERDETETGDEDVPDDIAANLAVEEDSVAETAVAVCSLSLPPTNSSSSFFFSSSSSSLPPLSSSSVPVVETVSNAGSTQASAQASVQASATASTSATVSSAASTASEGIDSAPSSSAAVVEASSSAAAVAASSSLFAY